MNRKIPTVKIFRKGIVNPLVATWIPDEVCIVDNFHVFPLARPRCTADLITGVS